MLTANRLSQDQIAQLRNRFGERLRQDVPLANYTAARVGGKADFVLTAQSAEDLESAVRDLWALEVPFTILGSGANVLVSDRGVRGVVILNRAQRFEIQVEQEPPTVWPNREPTWAYCPYRCPPRIKRPGMGSNDSRYVGRSHLRQRRCSRTRHDWNIDLGRNLAS